MEGTDPEGSMTYSIIARDPDTGQIGAAVQSFYFNVGPRAIWVRPGVGAVATQMMIEPAYGHRGLELMKAGANAGTALETLLAEDASSSQRQVAMLDAHGGVAAHTGAQCIAFSGHVASDGVSVQGAMLRQDKTWDAMYEAFQLSTGPLAERLISALKAAERVGGDVRGPRAAALIVVAGERTAQPWSDYLINLRVDDHPNPVGELERLLEYNGFFSRADRAFAEALAGNMKAALAEFALLERERAEDCDVAFRHGVLLALDGQVSHARTRLNVCYKSDAGWRDAVSRLPAAGFLPADPDMLAQLLGES